MQLTNEEINQKIAYPLDYCYKMNHSKRGLCLIFNHERFCHLSRRRGTHFDRNRLRDTFTSLQFKVKIFQNRRKQEIMGILGKSKLNTAFFLHFFFQTTNLIFGFSVANEDHSNRDCLVIVILSHGEIRPFHDNSICSTILNHDVMSHVHAADEAYSVQSLCEFFTDERCPSLANKPKIVLIQACQNEKKEYKTTLVPYARILPQKDFLISYSCSPGYKSFRTTEYGSWFIQTLCDELDKRGSTQHLQQILTHVSYIVFQEYESDGIHIVQIKQIPCVITRLTKLVFFPKKKPNFLIRLFSCVGLFFKEKKNC